MATTLEIHEFTPTEVDGELFQVLEFKGTEQISQPFKFDLHCVLYHNVFDYSGRVVTFFDALDSTLATIFISSPTGSGDGQSRTFRGYVHSYEVLTSYLDPNE